MTTPRDFTKNTGYGRANNNKYPRELFAPSLNIHHGTINLQRHTKQLKPSHALLFDLLPTVILTDIEIWLSGLKYHDSFKPVVLCITTMYNPILFAIPHDLWTTYHSFGVFCWYNEKH